MTRIGNFDVSFLGYVTPLHKAQFDVFQGFSSPLCNSLEHSLSALLLLLRIKFEILHPAPPPPPVTLRIIKLGKNIIDGTHLL